MHNNKLTVHRGFTPAVVAPPKCDSPRVIQYHRCWHRGGMCRQT